MTRSGWAPFVIAHRGASFDANENAESAIRLAIAVGARAIEIDVHRTLDGVIVVHHDEDLMRSCSDPRFLRDLRYDEVAVLRQRFAPTREPEPILTLEEAHACAAPLPLVVEIKARDRDPLGFARAVAELLARLETPSRPPERRSTIISFESEIVAEAARHHPAERVGLIRNTEYGEEGWRDLQTQPGGIAVMSSRIATSSRVAALREADKTVFCYALDDEESVLRHVAMGVEGILSNRPAIALSALARRPRA